MKLWYREGGEGGQRLVLIHGMGANADVWEPLKPYIEQRWLAPDLRGHGRSPQAACARKTGSSGSPAIPWRTQRRDPTWRRS